MPKCMWKAWKVACLRKTADRSVSWIDHAFEEFEDEKNSDPESRRLVEQFKDDHAFQEFKDEGEFNDDLAFEEFEV